MSEKKEFENLTLEQLKEQISLGNTVVDFYATWCGPCKMLSPQLDMVEENTEIKVIKLDSDKNMDLAVELGVKSVPTMLFYKDGEHFDTHIGMLTAQNIEAKFK